MSRKERFTPHEKEIACIDYIEGNRSRAEICNELHISTRTIQDWAAIYNKYGITGFTKKTKNRSYSKQFKIELVEKYLHGEASSIDLGNQYDVSFGLLRSWIRKYNANIELKDYEPRQEVYMAEARRKTSKKEREEIVAYCLKKNRDHKNTAAQFNVSYNQVYNWVKNYDASESVEIMCSLFLETAIWVAAELNYEYNNTEADNGMYFLQAVRDLPKDASEVL